MHPEEVRRILPVAKIPENTPHANSGERTFSSLLRPVSHSCSFICHVPSSPSVIVVVTDESRRWDTEEVWMAKEIDEILEFRFGSEGELDCGGFRGEDAVSNGFEGPTGPNG